MINRYNLLPKVLILLLALLLIQNLFAQDELPARPEPPRLVNDFAGMLTPSDRDALENKLVQFNTKTSTQIAIVTINDLKGYDKADYAFRLAEKWGIGQKGKNNGILILVKPKTQTSNGDIYIAVGYGLEGVVPDIVAKKTITNEILPAFRQGDFYAGLDRGTNILISLTEGEYTADQYLKAAGKKNSGAGGIGVIILILIILFFINRGRNNHHNIGSHQSFWSTLLLMGMLGGNRGGGSWGDFSSGRGSWGGGSGGGFGGFGGGSFGGGGAGGSW